MKEEHMKWANFCSFVIFIFTKLAQADNLSPAVWMRLVPIHEIGVQGSGLHVRAKVIIHFIIIPL